MLRRLEENKLKERIMKAYRSSTKLRKKNIRASRNSRSTFEMIYDTTDLFDTFGGIRAS